MTSSLRGPLVVLLIGGAAAGGFLGYRMLHGEQPAGRLPTGPTGAAATSVAASADVDAAQPAEASRPEVPESVPDIKLPDLKGQEKPLRSYLGRPVIINFWATWCGPCRREIPLLKQLRQAHAGERLEVVGIAVDTPAAVSEYLQKTPIEYPLLVGQDQGYEAAEKFGMELLLPFSVFADAQGRIIAVKVGELHQNEADYILGAMQQVAAGKKSIKDARNSITEKLRSFAVERAKAGTSDS
jgi:thiol-disulfide isomerase/thioredoxin